MQNRTFLLSDDFLELAKQAQKLKESGWIPTGEIRRSTRDGKIVYLQDFVVLEVAKK